MKLYDLQEPSKDENQPKDENLGPILGIDLGTTNSLIALSIGLNSQIIEIDGSFKVPSVVALDTNTEGFLVGNGAINAAQNDDKIAIHSVKRAIASHQSSVELDGKKFSPIEITSSILKYLKGQAEMKLKQEISQVVITVPAYFDEAARNATKQAASLAGLKVRRMLNEPTAAAIAYNLDKKVSGHVLVFDMGGGTFDVSILKMQMGVFQVIATGGDNHLGGDDYDDTLESLINKNQSIKESNDTPPTRLQIRALKEHLCSLGGHEQSGDKSFESVLLEDFENASSHLTKRAINITKKVIRDANLDLDQIGHVILVGGATRIPFLRDAVINLFKSQNIHDSLDPDLAVVTGASYQAEYLSGTLQLHGNDDDSERPNMQVLVDVIPLSLGIELADSTVEKIIYRNTPLPVEFKKMFTTSHDGQSGIKIHIVQGEAEGVEDCRSIAEFELTDIPPMEAGQARLEVVFNVDVDGLLSVTATEKVSGIVQHVEVKPSYGLSQDEAIQLVMVGMKESGI